MRVLFFGTSPFAVPTLQALHDAAPRHSVIGVVTQPDRPSGRGMKLHFSPVKELALALGYPVFQPERVRRKPFPAEVAALAPDALVVISFGQIIPQAMLDQPRFGGINVHASLLPRWRGAAPIHHALIAGDAETGVATMQMEATLDTGPTYLVARTPIELHDTVATLEGRLAAMGAPLLIETLDELEAGALSPTTQPEDGMTYAAPVTREMGFLDPAGETAESLWNRIRGTNPRPGAFLAIDGRTLKILDAHPETVSDTVTPGSVAAIRKDGVLIGASDGTALLLTRVQPENKGPMTADAWARGARIAVGATAAAPAS